MSPTSILNGCIAMLIDVSRNISAMNPKVIAPAIVNPNEPALGSRHITMIATAAPSSR